MSEKLKFDLDHWMGRWDVVIPVKGYRELLTFIRELESASCPNMNSLAGAMHDAAIRYANGHTVDFQHEAREFLLESASQPGGGEAVLAPREATEEMLNATRGKNCSPGTWNNWQKKRHATIYRQMIAALAAPSAGNGGAEGA